MKALVVNKKRALLALVLAASVLMAGVFNTLIVFAEGETPADANTQAETTGETDNTSGGTSADGAAQNDASESGETPSSETPSGTPADQTVPEEKVLTSDGIITLEKDTFTYNGQAKEPLVSVTTSKGEPVPEGCYDVKYTNNVNAGTATATITYNKNAEDYGLTGSQSVKYTIEKCTFAKANTVLTNKVAYNGKTKKVKFYFHDSVTEKNIKLTEGTDFTVKVAGKKKLKEMGIYTIRLTGKGNFKGYVRYKFYITPKAVRSLSEKSRSAKAITIKWKAPKSCEVDGYVVCYTDSKGKYVKKKTTKLQYKVACNEAFYVSADVYSYKVVGKKTIKSAASKNFYGGLKPVGTPKFTLTEGWDSFKVKPDKEGDYQVYVSYEKGFDNGTVKDSKWYFNGENPLSMNVDSSEHGKTWWVKIRQYTEVDGAIRMGEFTEPQRVTVY